MCKIHTSLEQPEKNEKSLFNLRKSKGRLKIWDLHTRYHCSVLGTCLTLKELRHIAYKAKIPETESFSDYDLHVSFVSTLNERSYISNLVNKLLDKKYKRNIQQLSKAKTNEERNKLWNKSIEEGDVAGAFWALVSHSEINESTLYNAYGKVHMLSHLSGASLRIDMQEFHRLKHRNVNAEQEIKQVSVTSRKQLNKKNKEIAQLESQLLTATNKNTELLSAAQELKTIKENPIIDSLQLELDKLKLDNKQAKVGIERASDAVDIWKKRAKKEQKQREILEQKLIENHQEKQALENNLTTALLKKKAR